MVRYSKNICSSAGEYAETFPKFVVRIIPNHSLLSVVIDYAVRNSHNILHLPDHIDTQLDLSDPVIENTAKTGYITGFHYPHLTRTVLQAPLYCVFFITVRMIKKKNAGPLFWTIEIIVTGIFVWFSIWLFRNVSTLNKDKR